MFCFFTIYQLIYCLIDAFDTSSYHQPNSTEAEKVEVREMINPSHPVKNKILSMSDLHLDCEWSKNMDERLFTFITKLASVAEVRTDQRTCCAFCWEENLRTNRKILGTRIKTNNKPNPHIGLNLGLETRVA